MNIGIIGSGISSLAAAYYLKKKGHRITLIEEDEYFGGHSHTVDVEVEGRSIPVDTGFLVHNDFTYPLLIDFFRELEIPVCASDMSFSVQVLREGLEWSSEAPFLQKRNLLSPRFRRMVRDILRFNRNAERYIAAAANRQDDTMAALLREEGYSDAFAAWYLIPVAAAIWSTPPDRILDYPAAVFLTFFRNHGLLSVRKRMPWKTIPGGSRIYVDRVIAVLDKAVLDSPVESVIRDAAGVHIASPKVSETFDRVISGVHAPENLRIVKDLSHRETEVLGSFSYQENQVYLHRDPSFLPRNKRGWESWNYLAAPAQAGRSPVSVSYYINHLQPLDTDIPMIVTLNPHKPVEEESLFRTFRYSHPLFDGATVRAQKEIPSIQGSGGLYYTGAWQRYGFHEDGIWSAMRALESMEGRET